MSGPLGNDDIEDVVSSVRRLVSPEARPRTNSRDAGADRLILTPALQVVGGSESVNRLLLTVPLAEDRAGKPTNPLTADTAAVATEPEINLAAPEPTDPILQEGNRAVDPVAADSAAPSEPTVLFGTDAEEGVAPAGSQEEWEGAFWSEQAPDLAELALSVEEAELVEPIPEAAMDDVVVVASAVPEAERSMASGGVVPFPGAIQPATVAVADASGVEPGAEASPRQPDGDAARAAEQLDEESLILLVRTLIREELQGALGERITQNVRKLVRAEINRALTARSLD